jgi:hypothetical protein
MARLEFKFQSLCHVPQGGGRLMYPLASIIFITIKFATNSEVLKLI